jgi:glycosyltransferase involved in cell wall biosynthesis
LNRSADTVTVAINAWFADQPTTGSGQYISRLLPRLKALAPEWQFEAIGPDVSSATYRLLGENLYKTWFEQVVFARRARRTGAHLAHVPYWASPMRNSCPTAVTIHDLIPLILPQYRKGWRVRAYTRLVSTSARRADQVITVSEASKRDIVEFLRLPPNRVYVTYEAAAPEYQPQAAETVAEVRRRLELPPRYVLYFGGFDWRKNLETVVEAFARLAAQAPDAALVIAGHLPERDTEFTPDPCRLAREAGVEARTCFIGWVEEADKPPLYAGAEAMVFPSRYEGFGLPPLEAMACGTPVIASNTGSLPEIIADGGLLHSPGDHANIAESLLALWRNAELRQSLASRARARAAQFSWERTAAETLAVYEKVLNRANA